MTLFERVLSSEESRHAFFNTTQGILTGDPSKAETKEVLARLSGASIAFLFQPDEFSAYPSFHHESAQVFVGRDEIERSLGFVAAYSQDLDLADS